MATPKYYVVWHGKKPGIYTTWEACSEQVMGYSGARYKSFKTMEEARAALAEGAPAQKVRSAGRRRKPSSATSDLPPNPPTDRHDTVLPLPLSVRADAIAVDAACSGNPGQMEYRGVDLATGAVVFHVGPVFGTNNIGEFLAIVHALAHYTAQGKQRVIYSDSRNAILWVKAGKCRTTLVRNAKTQAVYQLIARAEQWLHTHDIKAWTIEKWHTSSWGEIPADFGRKG